MKAGQLRNRITIQTSSDTISSEGDPVHTYSTYHSCYAQIVITGGSETARAERTTADVNAEITIRYKSGVTPKMRVVHGSDTYEIEAVVADEKKSEQKLVCRKTT